MARRTICVKDANEVEIKFQDKSYVATFNMVSVRYLQEAMDSIKDQSLSYEHFAALALYSGIKVNDPEFTMEEGSGMILTMRPADVNEIMEEYADSVNGISIGENKEELKKALAQILGKISGISTKQV